MYYEINVSLHGNHFFATDKRSITSLEELYAAHRIFKKKFPESEGFQLSATRYQLTGESLNLPEMIKPKLIGWHFVVHLDNEEHFVQECSQEWDNVLIDARDTFDAMYGDSEGNPCKAVKIDVYNEWNDHKPSHRLTWSSKEEVV